MTHHYQIAGMTCGNCVANVKNELLKLGDVMEADVSLSAPQATITMQKHIPVAVLQQAISNAGKFSISEADVHQETEHAVEAEAAALQAYWPLILVFSFITGVATIASFRQGEFHWMDWMNYIMAGFFIAFSFFKFLDLKGFADSYSTYDLLAQRWRTYGYIYPFLELALGIAFMTGVAPVFTNVATILIMGFSSIGVIRSVMNKRKIQCACLGTVFNLPMSTVTIVEDLAMVFMASLSIVTMY